MSDRIEIKDLDLLETVADDDEIAVQRKADGVVYKAEKSTLKGDKGMNWQGEWVAGTYQIDDVVEHNGSSWIATAVTTQEPSAVASEWDLVAERGEDGDDGQGVPVGGSEGQVLAKASATDFDTAWVNQSGGPGGSFTVATPEEINTGEDNEKGVTPQGLRDSLYPRVYRQDEEPTLADGDVWVNTGEEELVDTEGGQTEEFDNGNSGSAVTIDWNNGRHQKLTLTDDCAITFTDPQFVGGYSLRIVQGGAGNHDITAIPGIFPASEPTWNQGETDDQNLLSIYHDGTNYIITDTGYYSI